jgi:predicted dehydrogenase
LVLSEPNGASDCRTQGLEEERMRAALIGCGEMSRAWLKAAREIDGLTIVGLADLDESRARGRASEFGLGDAIIAPDIGSLLARSDPDVVFDVVVPAPRYSVVRAALAAGCHVLSEKPLADSLDHARGLVQAAREAGRLHGVMQNRRYAAGVRRLERFLRGGAIGDVTAVHCDFFKAPHFGGFREEMRHVLLLDMAIHTFDAARLLAGSDAESVYCQESNPTNSWYAHGAAANAIFTLGNGTVLTYRGSWCADGVPTSWESAWRIVGTRGSVIWDGEDGFVAEAVREPVEKSGLFAIAERLAVPRLDPADRVDGHLGVMRDFVHAVRQGTEPETVSHQNIKSLAMVFGAIESAETGRRVAMETI